MKNFIVFDYFNEEGTCFETRFRILAQFVCWVGVKLGKSWDWDDISDVRLTFPWDYPITVPSINDGIVIFHTITPPANYDDDPESQNQVNMDPWHEDGYDDRILNGREVWE